jgi:uncharacterized membrane protein YdfJ with MMPL/SSD domain
LVPVSNLEQYLVAFIGLGIAIDYSLLIVTRWREERESAASKTTTRSWLLTITPGGRCC